MREEKRVIIVDPDEHSLIVNGLNEFRNSLITDFRPTEDVDELLLKVIDAPTKKQVKKRLRNSR